MKKKFLLPLLCLAGVFTACSKDEPAPTPAPVAPTVGLTAVINGAQQVPVNSSTATGNFTGTYTTATRSLTYRIVYTGLTPSIAHIHTGAPGANGSVAIPFATLTSPIEGSATLSPQQADDLLNNRMYVNIHTTGSPGGEIRGNIVK